LLNIAQKQLYSLSATKENSATNENPIPTFCSNNQHIHWTAIKAALAYFAAVLHSQTTHQNSHFL